MFAHLQPKGEVMGKHLMDHRDVSNSGRMLHFMAIARAARATWHRSEAKAGTARVVQFCRIARGRLA